MCYRKHEHLFHTDMECACGETFDLRGLARHYIANVCPERIITCRFCGNEMRAGNAAADAVDRIRGYTEHEAVCGQKTILCHICNAYVRQRDLPVHAQLHSLDRQQGVGAYANARDGSEKHTGQRTPNTGNTTTSTTSTKTSSSTLTDAERQALWARAGFGHGGGGVGNGQSNTYSSISQHASLPVAATTTATTANDNNAYPPGFFDPVEPVVRTPPVLCACTGCKYPKGLGAHANALGTCKQCWTQLGISSSDVVDAQVCHIVLYACVTTLHIGLY